jgi:glycosyltransferase involved in cell wall biosynthesis
MTRSVAVIPAHDEQETVASVVERARRHVDVVLVVDDGSRDSTADRAHEAGAEILQLRPNRGKGGALRAGLARAVELGAEIVITLDADGEHDPDQLPKFLEAIENADVVLGARQVYRSGTRRALNQLALFWFQLLDPNIQDTICGYRAFRTAILPKLESAADGFAYEQEVVLLAVAAGLRLATVGITTDPRERSHVTSAEMVKANNRFDRWVLAHLGTLQVKPWRKALLAAGCVAGLTFGAPAEWVLERRRAS